MSKFNQREGVRNREMKEFKVKKRRKRGKKNQRENFTKHPKKVSSKIQVKI